MILTPQKPSLESGPMGCLQPRFPALSLEPCFSRSSSADSEIHLVPSHSCRSADAISSAENVRSGSPPTPQGPFRADLPCKTCLRIVPGISPSSSPSPKEIGHGLYHSRGLYHNLPCIRAEGLGSQSSFPLISCVTLGMG